jgi:hypothetical protein
MPSKKMTVAESKIVLAHAKKWHAKAARMKAHFKQGGCRQTYMYWTSLEVHYAAVMAGCVGLQRKVKIKKARDLGL